MLQLASLIAVIAAWQVISGPIINSYYLSTPRAVFSQIVLWITSGALWPHLVSTLVTTLVGFAIAAAVAIPLALWISSHPFVDRVLSPMIYAAYSMPKIVLAPALILWLGIGHLPAVTLSAVTAFFLVFFNFYLGLKQVPSIYADTAALLDASGLDTALKFRLPAASAHLATGISQGLIYAFHGALVGEMTASDTGMGYLILFAGSKMDSTGVMAGLMIVGTLALLLTRFLNFAFRTVVQPGAEGHV
ncbi:ABC transporter permease [Methyloceanibacter sp.]|uniref:ABC transporter permease n=1 Tax=Methyloceanibacter sp. TaxID=1965321 RepID=UPI003D6D6078